MSVKWGKQKLEGVKLDTSEPVELFKAQLYTLTQVPPERQKIMGVKGGAVKARRQPAYRPLHPPRARRAPTNRLPRGHAACGARHSTLAQDNANWEDLKVKDGQVLMLMGTADKLPEPPAEKTVFVEVWPPGPSLSLLSPHLNLPWQDLPPAEIAAKNTNPGGLANLGNTCYLNSSLQ